MNFLTNKNYDVFISYSRKDYDAVKQFCSLLQHHNISYWIDKEKIDAELFKAKIIEGIDSSRIFLFFSSVSANRSQWTEKEIGYADKKKMTIIPVKLDNSAFSSNVQLDLVNRNSYNFTVKDKKLKTENTKGLLRALYKVKGLKEPFFFNEEQIDKFVEGEIRPGGGNPPPYWKKLLIVLVVVFLGIIGAFLYY